MGMYAGVKEFPIQLPLFLYPNIHKGFWKKWYVSVFVEHFYGVGDHHQMTYEVDTEEEVDNVVTTFMKQFYNLELNRGLYE